MSTLELANELFDVIQDRRIEGWGQSRSQMVALFQKFFDRAQKEVAGETEQFNLTDLIHRSRMDEDTKEGWLRWALLAFVTQVEKNSKAKAKDIVFPDRKEGEPLIANVTMIFNGHPVKFSELLIRMRDAFDREVERTARNLIPESIRKATESLTEVCEKFEQEITSAANKFAEHLAKQGTGAKEVE